MNYVASSINCFCHTYFLCINLPHVKCTKHDKNFDCINLSFYNANDIDNGTSLSVERTPEFGKYTKTCSLSMQNVLKGSLVMLMLIANICHVYVRAVFGFLGRGLRLIIPECFYIN